MSSLILYTRVGCHLCDDAKTVLDRVRGEIPFDLEVVDVDTDDKLAEMYGQEVPVLLIEGRKRFKYRIEENRLRRLLQAGTKPL